MAKDNSKGKELITREGSGADAKLPRVGSKSIFGGLIDRFGELVFLTKLIETK
jgi:hypothetical protein